MKKHYARIGAALAWVAVLVQLIVMLDNRVTGTGEALIRFFSFFTILTNTLLALYFSSHLARGARWWLRRLRRPGVMTAITVYISVVGLVYQLILRPLWSPTGVQMITDELLHSVNPLYMIAMWVMFEDKRILRWSMIPLWLIYPLIYLACVLLRGAVANWYPYPFIDVGELGYGQVGINALGMLVLFVVLSALFVGVAKLLQR
ncbi:MAG: Pr6Pr family membrane protein [Saprospiraceae bacterium]|nr:Pr6Pr family membrane protein [Saprospiraceae bacterium]